METINERLKKIRIHLDMSQEEFGKSIGITSRAHISALESGTRNITQRIFNDVCSKHNVNKEWFKDGIGGDENMINPIPEEDEIAAYVEELLEPDNPFSDLIIEIMRTYSQCDPKSQEVLKNFSKTLLDNIKKEG